MYITILQENLQKGLQFVSKALSSKPQLPILSNILLHVLDGQLRITTTNMETTMTARVDVKVEKEGSITVPAKPFFDFVNSLPAGNIELSYTGNKLKAQTNNSTAAFVTIPADEFPPLPQKGKKPDFSFTKEAFSQILSLVCLSAATDEGRPILTGVNLTGTHNTLVFAATDGFRLSTVSKKVSFQLDKPLTIPARTLQEVLRITENSDDEVGVYTTPEKNQIFFTSDTREIATRLIEGQFPNYQKIIPESHTTRVVIEKEALLTVVKTASIFARQSANVVRLAVESGTMTISANAAQIGENKSTIDVTNEGEGGEIAFNVRFLLDFLSNFKDETVVFEMAGPLNPGVFKSEKDTSFLHIIMPVRVQN